MKEHQVSFSLYRTLSQMFHGEITRRKENGNYFVRTHEGQRRILKNHFGFDLEVYEKI